MKAGPSFFSSFLSSSRKWGELQPSVMPPQGRELGHWDKCWALGRAVCYSLVFSLILSLQMRQRRQRDITFMSATVPPRCSKARTAAFVPATAALISRRVQALRWQAARALQGNKSRRKMFFQWQLIKSTRSVTGDTKGSFVAGGLLPPTKYQTSAASKGSRKAFHRTGHKSLLCSKVLRTSNTEVVIISSYNEERINNWQDLPLFGKTVFTKLFREHPQFCTFTSSMQKCSTVSPGHRAGRPGTPDS